MMERIKRRLNKKFLLFIIILLALWLGLTFALPLIQMSLIQYKLKDLVGEGVNTGVGISTVRTTIIGEPHAYVDSAGRRYALFGFEWMGEYLKFNYESRDLVLFMCPKDSDPLIASNWKKLDLGAFSEGVIAELNPNLMVVFARYHYKPWGAMYDFYGRDEHTVFRISVSDAGMSIISSVKLESISWYYTAWSESRIFAFKSQNDVVVGRSMWSYSADKNSIRVWRISSSAINEAVFNVNAENILTTGVRQNSLGEDWIFYIASGSGTQTGSYRVNLNGLTWGIPITAKPITTSYSRFPMHYEVSGKSYLLYPVDTGGGGASLGYYDNDWVWTDLVTTNYWHYTIDQYRHRLLIIGGDNSRLFDLQSNSFIGSATSPTITTGVSALTQKNSISTYGEYDVYGEGIKDVSPSGETQTFFFYWAYYVMEKILMPTALSIDQTSINTVPNYDFELSGILTSSGMGLSGKIIYLQMSVDQNTWIDVTSCATDSDGKVTFTIKESLPGIYYYRLRFLGDVDYLGSTSDVCTVTVNIITVELTIDPKRIDTVPGINYRINGTLKSLGIGLYDKTVLLQRSKDGITWTDVSSSNTDSYGRVSFTDKLPLEIWGNYYYRLQFIGDSSYSGTISQNCTVVNWLWLIILIILVVAAVYLLLHRRKTEDNRHFYI